MFLHSSSKTPIRRTIVTVKKPSGVSKFGLTSSHSSPASSVRSSARPSPTAPSSQSRSNPLNNQHSSSTNSTSGRRTDRTARKQTKRKPTVLADVVSFSDSEDDEASDLNTISSVNSDAESNVNGRIGYNENSEYSPSIKSSRSSQRQRELNTPSLSPESKARDRRDTRSWSEADSRRWNLVHGADLTSMSTRTKYTPMFNRKQNDWDEVELQYPSALPRERFALVVPINDNESYSPVDDILHTMDIIIRHFLPSSLSEELSSPISGLVLRFRRAVLHQSFDSIKSIVSEFNKVISSVFKSGRVPMLCSRSSSSSPSLNPRLSSVLSFQLSERILAQVYSRTVSPQVELLKQYENGTSDVYGELLPRFISQIFAETGLKKDSVFVDFGSGVGNVVLQAALETGCESWGIEKNDNPAKLGSAQLREFSARTRLWGIKPGKAKLLHGDFLTSPEIDTVLSRADVILVNNKAFLPSLNDRLLMKFLDVKEGARIVSLRSFLPKGWQIKPRNTHDLRNLLKVERKEYFSGSVSWTDSVGEYFIATKDSGMLRDYIRRERDV